MNQETKPYTYETVGVNIFGYPKKYVIMFDGQVIREIVNMLERDVKDLIVLLNAAYQLGANSAQAAMIASKT